MNAHAVKRPMQLNIIINLAMKRPGVGQGDGGMCGVDKAFICVGCTH